MEELIVRFGLVAIYVGAAAGPVVVFLAIRVTFARTRTATKATPWPPRRGIAIIRRGAGRIG